MKTAQLLNSSVVVLGLLVSFGCKPTSGGNSSTVQSSQGTVVLDPTTNGGITMETPTGQPIAGPSAGGTAEPTTAISMQNLNESVNVNVAVFQSSADQSVAFNLTLLEYLTTPPYTTDANGHAILTQSGQVTCSFMINGTQADTSAGQAGFSDGGNGVTIPATISGKQLNLAPLAAAPVYADITQDNSLSDASNACTSQISDQDKADLINAWVAAAQASLVFKPYHLGCLGGLCF